MKSQTTNHAPKSRQASRRCTGDGGAAFVEFALIVPVLVVFMLGIIDYGMLFRADNQLEHALMSGGRVAAQQSSARFADYEALRMLTASLSGISNSTVSKVVIYKASAADGKIPTACLTASQSGVCNYYDAVKFKTFTKSNFPTTTGCVGGWDVSWCPTTRNANTDRIGVYVELKYTRMTGIIPGNFTIKHFTVYSIEPKPLSVGADVTP